MNHSSLENVKPEQMPNSEQNAQDISVSPAIGNANVVGSTVYLMDCIAGMKHYPDKFFDLAIVDPPYGIGQPKQGNLKGYNGRPDLETRMKKNRLNTGAGKLKDRVLNTANTEWDNETPSDEYFLELWRVSKERIIWGGNYFDLPPTRGIICWDKCQPWENFSQIEYAWTSFDKPAALFKFDNRTGDKIHPTQKPVELYRWLLNKYGEKGQKILDTHLGSGSSRIAADKDGFEFVGFEINKDYYELSEKRFNNYKSQLRIEGW